jgi:inosose dehydratase
MMSTTPAFDRSKTWLGITPTLWWNDDFPLLDIGISFEQCISEIALSGFQGCSIGHKYPADPALLSAALTLRGLRISEPWVSTFFTVPGEKQKTIDEVRAQLALLEKLEQGSHDPRRADLVVAEFGNSVHLQSIALFPNIPDFTDEQWDALVDGLNEIGKIAADQGRSLCYHPHLGTGVMSPAAVECLFDRTDPRLVHMLLDTAHLMAGGCDALEITKRYAHRIKHVHLKDVRAEVLQKVHDENLSFEEAVVAGIFTVPGDGSIKTLPEILNQLAKAGFTGWLMIEAEQKPRGDEPLMYAKKARAFLHEHMGW